MQRRIPWLSLISFTLALTASWAEAPRIGGRVLMPGGEPLPRAEVRLVPLLGPLAEARSMLEDDAEAAARALTDDEGRFRLAAPHAGLWKVRVQVKGFVPAETELAPLIEPVELPVLRLAADSGVRVKVVDAAGSPVSGAAVLARTDRGVLDYGRSVWSSPLRAGRTAADGTLTLSKADRERVALSASLSGHAPAERRGVIGTTTTVRLAAGVSRTIEVRSADGNPEAGVLVSAGRDPHPLGTTDDGGRLTLHVDPSRPTELTLLAEDGRSLSQRFEVDRPRGQAEEKEEDGPRLLTLPDRARVAGKLIDADSRRAIDGGLVWSEDNPLEAAATDGDGSFVLGGRTGSRIQITAGAPGYLTAGGTEFQLNDDGRPGPVLALRPAAAIEGRVIDADGDPVDGAEVTVERRRMPGQFRIEIGRPRPATRNLSGRKGEFRLSPIDPEPSYTVKVQAEGYAPAEHVVSDLRPYRTTPGVEIVLTRGQRVRGTVVDVDGRPLREVALALKPDRSRGGMGMMRVMDGGGSDPGFEGASGDDGRFDIEGVPAGKFALEAHRRGFAKKTVPAIEVEKGAEAVELGEIVLEPGERIQGYVSDRDGQPVEGVEVHVEGSGPAMVMMMDGAGPQEEPDAITDPGGWFAVEDLAAGETYSLGLSRSGFVTKSVKGIQLPRAEPVEAVIEPASDVSGMVIDAEGEPIPGAQLTLERRQTIEMGRNVMMTMMAMQSASDGEGRFVFEDQSPGKITLKAVASGYQQGELKDIEVPKGEDLEGVELRLPAGAVLVGQVYAPDGSPFIGARINRVTAQDSPMRMFQGAPTDGNGTYRLEGLEPGELSVEAMHDDYPRAVKDVELAEGINELDLYFEGGVEVSGRVVDASGKPVPDAAVRLAAGGHLFGGPQTRCEADGSFVMPGVQDGDYRLWVEAEGYAASAGRQGVTVAGQAVQDLEVRLDRGATVSGRITGLEPEQFGEVGVRASGGEFAGFDDHSFVDREGNYRVENLLPGSYDIVASLSDTGRKATSPVTIDEGATEARVDLKFKPGLTLSGTVVQGEQPLAGVTLIVEGLDSAHTGWAQSDESGAFAVDGLEPGSHDVSVRDWTSGLAYRETVEMATSRKIVLEIPTARVAGRIVDSADRGAVAGVSVTLTSGDPVQLARLPVHTATTDLEGRFEVPGIADGSWKLAATKEGYSAISRPVQIDFENPVDDLELMMDATEGMTLEARLPTGAPPDELRVAVLDPAGGALVSGTYPTGENGRVRLSSVPPGTWELVVSAEGSATVNLEGNAPGATVPVALQPATDLRITVPDLAQASSLAAVTLRDAAGKLFRTLSWNGRPQSEWRMTGGEMVFRSLPPGGWKVTVAAPDGRSWTGESTTSPGASAVLRLE